uniref:Uncharacterized protein n=1 Tax=Arundo donax TaxID=35708 RepID=A0A0A8ZEF9_ARUDO
MGLGRKANQVCFYLPQLYCLT